MTKRNLGVNKMLFVSIGYMEQAWDMFFVNVDYKGGKSLKCLPSSCLHV